MGLRVFKSWNWLVYIRNGLFLGYRMCVCWALFDYIVGTADGYCVRCRISSSQMLGFKLSFARCNYFLVNKREELDI